MLVLSRQDGESLRFEVSAESLLNLKPGEKLEFEIKVLQIRQTSVRLGVEAPKDVGVWRTELKGAA